MHRHILPILENVTLWLKHQFILNWMERAARQPLDHVHSWHVFILVLLEKLIFCLVKVLVSERIHKPFSLSDPRSRIHFPYSECRGCNWRAKTVLAHLGHTKTSWKKGSGWFNWWSTDPISGLGCQAIYCERRICPSLIQQLASSVRGRCICIWVCSQSSLEGASYSISACLSAFG